MNLTNTTLEFNSHKKWHSCLDIVGSHLHGEAIKVITRMEGDATDIRSRLEIMERLIACYNAFSGYPTNAIHPTAVKPYTGDHNCELSI